MFDKPTETGEVVREMWLQSKTGQYIIQNNDGLREEKRYER